MAWLHQQPRTRTRVHIGRDWLPCMVGAGMEGVPAHGRQDELIQVHLIGCTLGFHPGWEDP
jgi:uncharacterized protein YndB with AHSA1/START domain